MTEQIPTQEPDKSKKRRLTVRGVATAGATALALAASAAPAAAETPVNSDRAAVSRLTSWIRGGDPRVTFDISEQIRTIVRDPENPNGTLNAVIARPVEMMVGDEEHIFTLQQTNPKHPSLKTIKVTPMGAKDELDVSPSPQGFYKPASGTRTHAHGKIILNADGNPAALLTYSPDSHGYTPHKAGEAATVAIGQMVTWDETDPSHGAISS